MKNGTTHRGKQNYQCRDCGRQFVENPQRKTIDPQTFELIERLLLDRISLAGIARVLKLSDAWLQRFVNPFYEHIPRRVQVSPKAPSILILQLDELWSFVSCKANKQWIWLAIDYDSREIVGCPDSAQAFWQSLPGVYRQCATLFTDHWDAYNAVLPHKRHFAEGKESEVTGYIERFNNTLRQRVSRLVRRTLSFSKKQSNHEGAVWYFIHHYNAQIQSVEA
jgi:IS1 family transposase